jgi:alanyl-tRNA synthetase
MAKARIPEIDTALHIVKGAIVRVLKTPLTVSTECSKPHEGRLAVQWSESRAPTKEEVNQILELTNNKIRENVDVLVTEMDRKEAEEKFKNGVNSTFIYDKFPVPAQIQKVNVVLIDDWNVNCCVGTHLKKTGDVRFVNSLRFNHRPQKQELEFIFSFNEKDVSTNTSKGSSSAAPESGGKKQETTSQAPQQNVSPNTKAREFEVDNVDAVSDKILDEVLQALQQVSDQGKAFSVSQEMSKTLRSTLQPKISHHLILLKNASFSKGFHSHIES